MKWLWIVGTGALGIGLTACGPMESPPVGLYCFDAATSEVDEECGIWVSKSLGDDSNPGTRAAPMASLTAAADRAYKETKDVYACGGVWTEPLQLKRDVSLFGGFDCENGWVYAGEGYRINIETAPGEVPLTLVDDASVTMISDVRVEAADAVEPSGSSIGMMVLESTMLTLRRSKIVAGNGADGLDGDQLEELAPAGADGNAGADACTAANGLGGLGVETSCGPEYVSQSGNGGDSGPIIALDGQPGLPQPADKDPANTQDGDAGTGETGAKACAPGEPGQDGAVGESGKAAWLERGSASPDGFFPAIATDGEPGKPGQAGGGGGASRGGLALCGASIGGAGGGSGGAGGCGGKGGKAGKGGGSSFGVLILLDGSRINFVDTEIWIKVGGDGGDGAGGQPGGPGGQPGQGGAGQGMAKAGCPGGNGGAGGKGGPGAGGNGGHAAHIVYGQSGTFDTYPPGIFLGDFHGGLGGAGGDGNFQENGDDGFDTWPAKDYSTLVLRQ